MTDRSSASWSLTRIANVILPVRSPDRTWMAVCHAFFDCSGSVSDPAVRSLVIAGFLATETQWRRFERQWQAALVSEGITTLHMRDFAHSRREFAAWKGDEPRRTRLLQTLGGIIKCQVRRAFSAGLLLADYRAVNVEYQLAECGPHPYAICVALVTRDVRQWMAKAHPRDITLLVLERGDAGQKDLDKLEEMGLWQAGGHPPLVLPKQWTDEHGRLCFHRPFEACDYLAFELAHALPLIGADKAPRRSLTPVNRIPHGRGWEYVSKPALLALCAEWKIPVRAGGR